MKALDLQTLAEFAGGELLRGDKGAVANSVSTDTRHHRRGRAVRGAEG